jgi:transcriptional antiterminator RfaH
MNWFAVKTKPHQEHVAQLNLQRLGVETFLPEIKQNKVIRRKRQSVIGPLFPGYLFARFFLNTHYRAVTYARGVQKVVAFGPTPATVDDGIIEGIKSKFEDGYVTVPQPTFTPGQLVRIHQGPLQGMEAIFEREMSDNQRATLLLRTLAFQARVIVDIEAVANL